MSGAAAEDGRVVRLLLCDPCGAVLGALPPLPVDAPWWPEVEPIVRAVRHAHGLEVVVLRLLDGPDEPGQPGIITYLAEVAGAPPPTTPLDTTALPPLVEEPLRLPWARPGGVAEVVAWADAALAAAGLRRTGPATQVRSWNLSLILRLETSGGRMWVKAVPPFFAHEGAAIALLASTVPGLLPPLVAHGQGVVLLGHVPGEDQHAARPEVVVRLVEAFVGLQARWVARTGELLAAGLPDWRPEALTALADDLARRPETRGCLGAAEAQRLRALVADLPGRFTALADAGLPDTLVHGDLHPGNTRWDGRAVTILDWGDCGVGHALLDEAALLERVPGGADRRRIVAAWVAAWRAERPASDPRRALELVQPIAALRQAVIYRTFLDGIEPAERRYHEANVPLWLRRALDLARE